MNDILIAAALAASMLGSLLLTPAVRFIALRLGFVDAPDAHRKIHATATALGGGVAVLAGVACGVLPALLIPSLTGQLITGHPWELIGVALAVLIICLVGLWDDRCRLSARHKLIGQVAAASIVAYSGLAIEHVTLAGTTFELGWLSVPISVFWLVLCINALNLIDGADGLAAVVGIILCGTITCTAFTLQNELVAFAGASLTGSLLGFLRYNRPPATIFLGDAGSMSIGLLAGSLTIHSSIKGAAAYAMFAPLAMWLIPLMDVGMAVVRRKLTGRGLSVTDRSHLHHCLLDRGLTQNQLLGVIGALCLFCGLGAWLSVRFANGWFALVSAVAVMGFLIFRRLFGHVELQLAGQHLVNLRRNYFPGGKSTSSTIWQSKIRMQGVRPWEELWAFLVERAEHLSIAKLTLDLNLPWLHEGFHANWENNRPRASRPLPRLSWPLTSGDRTIGSLSIVGDANTEQILWLKEVVEFLASVQARIRAIEELPTTRGELKNLNGDSLAPFAAQEESVPNL